MRRYLIPVMAILALASGLLIGCGAEAGRTPTTQTDTPMLQSDEVCALVYNYLENKITAMTVFARRMQYLDTLSKARPDFQAVYQGNGKWTVAALGQWNLYEASGVIEPADDNARKWLHYIQQWTR